MTQLKKGFILKQIAQGKEVSRIKFIKGTSAPDSGNFSVNPPEILTPFTLVKTRVTYGIILWVFLSTKALKSTNQVIPNCYNAY